MILVIIRGGIIGAAISGAWLWNKPEVCITLLGIALLIPSRL